MLRLSGLLSVHSLLAWLPAGRERGTERRREGGEGHPGHRRRLMVALIGTRRRAGSVFVQP